MIGLSVSFCIRDIVAYSTPIEEVTKIIGATRCVTPEDWEEVIKGYRSTYWSKFPDEAEAVLRVLLADGRIEQPRVADPTRVHSIAKGHWVVSEDEIVWLPH